MTDERPSGDGAREEFIHNISHELKTPLVAFKGAVRLALSGEAGPLTQPLRQILEIADRNAEHLNVMIDDLLDMTRAQTGKLTIEPRRADLRELVEDVLATERTAAGGKDIALSAEVPADLPPAYADPVRIRQVLTNLIDNAFKFTHGGGKIAVRAALSQKRPGMLELSVADTGCGIPAEALDEVFDRLYQVRAGGGRKGLGIGLYLCKQLVERQKGRIWVESRLGVGSTFFFTLPVFSLESLLEPVISRGGAVTRRLVVLTVDVRPPAPRFAEEAVRIAALEARGVLQKNVYPGDLVLPEFLPEGEKGLVFVAASIDPGLAANMIRRLETALGGNYLLLSHGLTPGVGCDVVELEAADKAQAASEAARKLERLVRSKVSG